jgi:hypothetical protein
MGTATDPPSSCLPLPRDLVRGGVDWRRTFLRGHLSRELRGTSEILALREFGDPARVTAEEFFLAEPDYRLYQPVRVRPIEERDESLRAEFDAVFRREFPAGADRPPEVFDLTGLIQLLGQRGDGRSILLEARTGAGKSIAGRAAMFECFSAIDGRRPRLDGLLPCLLGPVDEKDSAIARVLRGDEVPAEDVVSDCLASTAGIAPGGAHP